MSHEKDLSRSDASSHLPSELVWLFIRNTAFKMHWRSSKFSGGSRQDFKTPLTTTVSPKPASLSNRTVFLAAMWTQRSCVVSRLIFCSGGALSLEGSAGGLCIWAGQAVWH